MTPYRGEPLVIEYRRSRAVVVAVVVLGVFAVAQAVALYRLAGRYDALRANSVVGSITLVGSLADGYPFVAWTEKITAGGDLVFVAPDGREALRMHADTHSLESCSPVEGGGSVTMTPSQGPPMFLRDAEVSGTGGLVTIVGGINGALPPSDP